MDEDLVRGVQVMVAQLAFLSAAIHVLVVLRRLPSAIASGTVPRLATILLGLAVLGVAAGFLAFRYELASRRTVYRYGIALMLAQVVGWLAYHNLELLGFGHSHGNPLWSVLAHVEADAVEATAKVAELLAAAGLALLLHRDPRASPPATDTRATMNSRPSDGSGTDEADDLDDLDDLDENDALGETDTSDATA